MRKHDPSLNAAANMGIQIPDRGGPTLLDAARAVADFLSGPKDRFGRVDVAADEAVRDARERVRQLAVHYGVTGNHTYIDQCAAVLNAAIAKHSGR